MHIRGPATAGTRWRFRLMAGERQEDVVHARVAHQQVHGPRAGLFKPRKDIAEDLRAVLGAELECRPVPLLMVGRAGDQDGGRSSPPRPSSAHSTRIPASPAADPLAASTSPTGADRITLGCYPQLRTAWPACPRASALAPARRPWAACRSGARLAVLSLVGAPVCRPGVLRRRPRMGAASGASLRGGSAAPQPEYRQPQARKRYQRPDYPIGAVV